MKTGFVALIGRPNVGKSTLLNALIGQKLSIVSHKPQTTRFKINAIYNDDDSQIIFIDTPGYHNPKSKLGDFMVDSAISALGDVDLIIMMIDSDYIGNIDNKLLEIVEESNKESILLINKTDTFLPDAFEKLYKKMSVLNLFSKITGISAINLKGIDELKSYIKELLPEGPRYYPEDYFTDQTERSIVAELIREKTLRFLNDEIPHGIAVDIIKMKDRSNSNIIDIEADIVTEKKSHKGIIIGKEGKMLKKIGISARKDIEELLDQHVNLRLFVKVREGWRDNNNLLKGFGFKKK